MTDEFYNSRAWSKLAKRLKTIAIREARSCPVCNLKLIPGQLLIVDHMLPRRIRPDLALDERNLKVLHHACHSKKTRWMDYSVKEPLDESGYPDAWR